MEIHWLEKMLTFFNLLMEHFFTEENPWEFLSSVRVNIREFGARRPKQIQQIGLNFYRYPLATQGKVCRKRFCSLRGKKYISVLPHMFSSRTYLAHKSYQDIRNIIFSANLLGQVKSKVLICDQKCIFFFYD